MKYLKSFENLGVSTYLFDIVDKIKYNLKNTNKFILKLNLRNTDITLNVEFGKNIIFDNGIHKDAYFQVVDPEKLIFLIYLTENNDDSILHEVKHLDRAVARNLKTDSYYYLNHVGIDVAQKYKHLLYNEDTNDLLIQSLYLINPDEFESYYNQFYMSIKTLITDNMKSEEKRKIIKNFLENQDIYKLYKFFIERDGFDLQDFFKNNNTLNEYLKILVVKIDQFAEHSNDYDKWITIISKLKIFLNLFKKNDNIDTTCVEINKYLNKALYKGWKKFHRLYAIFI